MDDQASGERETSKRLMDEHDINVTLFPPTYEAS